MTNSTTVWKEKRLSGLDHLRALAIVMVLFYHYRMFQHPEWLDKTIGFGWTGVDLFFVLSGYLISSQLFGQIKAGRRISFPEFFIKRFFRIIPAYAVVLGIYFLIPAFHEREALPPLWRFITFTQNFGFDIKNLGTFSHAWSLCVEEHFYLLLPLVLIALVRYGAERKGVYILLLLFVAGFIVRLAIWHTIIVPAQEQDDFWTIWYRNIYYPTYTRLDGLLMGVGIALLFAFRNSVKHWCDKRGNVLLASGIAVLTGAWFLCEDQESFYASIFGFPVVAMGYGLVVMGAVSASCVLYRYSSSITAFIAKLSFALYLSHKGVIHISQPLLEKTGIAPKGNLMFALCFILSLIGAYILNKAIEEPFLKIREKVLKRRRSRNEIVRIAERA
jgi:peptidoglycan/LPS O-acetylase OafA/YrhL